MVQCRVRGHCDGQTLWSEWARANAIPCEGQEAKRKKSCPQGVGMHPFPHRGLLARLRVAFAGAQ
jgi:hypothetical protein